MNHPPRALRDSTTVARLALGLLSLTLLLLGAGGLWTVQGLISLQRDMARQALSTNAAMIGAALQQGSLFILEVSYDPESATTDIDVFREYVALDIPSALELQSAVRLASSASRGDSVRRGGEGLDMEVAVLSPSGYRLLDAMGFSEDPAPDALARRDSDVLLAAALGETRSTASPVPGGPAVRVYQPLTGRGGQVVAVLALRSESPGESVLAAKTRQLTLAFLLVAAIIILLAGALATVIRRVHAAELAADQADRLRAIGTATAGIAHEIRNPLGIIALTVEELRHILRDAKGENPAKQTEALCDDLESETLRLRELTDQFLDFSRANPRGLGEEANATLVVQETVKLFQKGLPAGIEVACSLPGREVRVPIGAGRLRQILLNLLRNAQEALGADGGGITVSVRTGRSSVTIEVEDNGPGIDPENLRRVFDPFFTTRPEGSGLGLSLCRTLVEAVGGSLQIDKRHAGQGTVVSVRLPETAGDQEQ